MLHHASGERRSPCVACMIPCVRFVRVVRRCVCPSRSRNTRYRRLAEPYLTGTCTPQEAPNFAWRTNVKAHRRRLFCVLGRSAHYCAFPEEPYMKVSLHTARALIRHRQASGSRPVPVIFPVTGYVNKGEIFHAVISSFGFRSEMMNVPFLFLVENCLTYSDRCLSDSPTDQFCLRGSEQCESIPHFCRDASFCTNATTIERWRCPHGKMPRLPVCSYDSCSNPLSRDSAFLSCPHIFSRDRVLSVSAPFRRSFPHSPPRAS